MEKKTIKLIAFAGSTRRDSLNKKLAQAAVKGAAAAGAEVTYVDLADYPMPMYDGDLENSGGYPEAAKKLKALFQEADGFLIASPEYNSSYSAVLKNTIDWISRPSEENEAPLSGFNGKQASLMATSPGALGGLRGLFALRELLMNINVHVHPNMRSVGGGFEVFDEAGAIVDDATRAAVEGLGAQIVASLS